MSSLMQGPYRGLVPFGEADYAYFCGRSRETRILAANARSARITLLIGPSGVGKSSLLRAGVAHNLMEAAKANFATRGRLGAVPVVVSRWAFSPAGEMARKIEERVQELNLDLSAPPGRPDRPTRGARLNRLLGSWQQCGQGDLVLALDQIEEFFLYHSSKHQQNLFGCALAEILYRYPSVRLLFSVRADRLFLMKRLQRHLPALFENIFELDHLDEKAAREAITEPLAEWKNNTGAVIEIEPELIEETIRQLRPEHLEFQETGLGLGSAGESAHSHDHIQAPYLQLVLSRIWESETAAGSTVLHAQTLKRLKGVQAIARQHLREQMKPFSWPQKFAAAGMFQWLVTPSGAKVLYPGDDLVKKAGLFRWWARKVLDKLSAEGRILSGIHMERGVSYEIYHDQLGPAMLLWRRGFLARSFSATVGISLVIVLAWGVYFTSRAKRAENLASSYRVLSAALAAANQRPGDSKVYKALALFAADHSDNASAIEKQRLDQLLRQAFPLQEVTLGMPKAYGVAFSPNGTWVAYSGEDSRIGLFDRIASRLRFLDGPSPAHIAVAFSALSDYLAAAGSDGVVSVWKTANFDEPPMRLQDPARIGVKWNRVAWSPYKVLAAAAADGGIALWDIRTAKLIGSWKAAGGPVNSVAFSPDGITLFSAAADRSLKRWAVFPCCGPQRPEQLADQLMGHIGPVIALSLTRDGKRLASCDGMGLVIIWDLETGGHTELPQAGAVFGLDFNDTGSLLAIGLRSGVVRVLDTATWRPAAADVHTKPVNWLAFSSGGTRLAAAGDDGRMRIWNQKLQPILTMPPPDSIGGLVVNGNVTVGGGDGTVGIWDPLEAKAASFFAADAAVKDAVVSPSGKLGALTLDGGKVQIWDLASKKAIGRSIPMSLLPPSLTDDGWLARQVTNGDVELTNLYALNQRTVLTVMPFNAMAVAHNVARNEVLLVLGYDNSVEVKAYNPAHPGTFGANSFTLPQLVQRVAVDPEGDYKGVLYRTGGVLIRGVESNPLGFDLPGAESIALAPGGSAVAFGASQIQVVRFGRLVTVMTGIPVTGAGLSRDGSRIIATFPGNRVQVFAMDSAQALAQARREAQARSLFLTAEQCRQYLNGPCPSEDRGGPL